VNLNRRIETLEKQSLGNINVYRIIPKSGEGPEEARQRYCREKNITEADLKAGFVVQRVIVSPGHKSDEHDKPS
jgi:hypothetical protein